MAGASLSISKDGNSLRQPPIPRCELQGYDFEFDPPLDKKYECSICLLCQRDPIQTSCGHRFCSECIMHWLRYREAKCPEDNFSITEQDVFPDNFAKREILSLKVKCSYSKEGCMFISELNNIENHMKSCLYEPVLCPNNCTQTVLRKDLTIHKETQCSHRPTKCPHCRQDIPFNDIEIHLVICPVNNSILCPCCKAMVQKNELSTHFAKDCPKVIVNCIFSELDCSEKIERGHMLMHLQSSNIRHMRLLCKAVTKLQQLRNSECYTEKQQSSPQDHLPVSVASLSSSLQLSTSENGTIQKIPCSIASTMTSPLEIQTHKLNSSNQENKNILTTLDVPEAFPELQITQDINTFPFLSQMFDNSFLTGIPNIDSKIINLQQKNVYLEQKTRETELKLEQLEYHLALSKQMINDLTEKVTAMDTRYCNGMYIWRIKNFFSLKQQAENGVTKLIHSPGFYTSSFGYKLCIRVNIYHSTIPYLSLYVHFMKGDYDDYLDWPFSGRITLMVLDQNEQSDIRHNITETFSAKTNLDAFQKPISDRNPKGFGYMEFVALSLLENGPYIKHDTVVIKATVVVTQA